jgi:hypothetical protein
VRNPGVYSKLRHACSTTDLQRINRPSLRPSRSRASQGLRRTRSRLFIALSFPIDMWSQLTRLFASWYARRARQKSRRAVVWYRSQPGRSDGTCPLVPFHQLRPSHEAGRASSCIVGFGACSAFTRVTACTLAKSPSDSLHQRLQQFRCLPCCSDCYPGWSEPVPGRVYPRCGPPPFHGAPGLPTNRNLEGGYGCPVARRLVPQSDNVTFLIAVNEPLNITSASS